MGIFVGCGFMWVVLTNPLLKAELVGSLIQVSDMRKKLGQSMSDYVSREIYNWRSTPTIDEPINVMRTPYHHDFLESHDDLRLAYTNED